MLHAQVVNVMERKEYLNSSSRPQKVLGMGPQTNVNRKKDKTSFALHAEKMLEIQALSERSVR